jgi:hypothetical protein
MCTYILQTHSSFANSFSPERQITAIPPNENSVAVEPSEEAVLDGHTLGANNLGVVGSKCTKRKEQASECMVSGCIV